MRMNITLNAAARIVTAGPVRYSAALTAGWLGWRRPFTLLADTDPHRIRPDADDWRWLAGHWPALGLTQSPAPTMRDHAIRLHAHGLTVTDAKQAVWDVIIAAHIARHHPLAWSHALLQTHPDRWRQDAHPPLDPDPHAGWASVYVTPTLMPGVSGYGLACALADCAWSGRYRAPSVRRPGGEYHIPGLVWDRLDPHWFAGDPDW